MCMLWCLYYSDKLEYNSRKEQFVQLINADSLNWVRALNVFCATGVVEVYI